MPNREEEYEREKYLLPYRVQLIEDEHKELRDAVSDLRDFANSIRAYARLALLVWPVAQAGITALVVSILNK